MIQRHTELLRKLTQYSATSVPLLALATQSDAQVIYQDVDPDLVLTIGQSEMLDLDGDGQADIAFKVTTYGTGWYFAGLVPMPPYTTNLNAFAGYTMTFGGDPSIYPFPSLFEAGEIIDGNLPWLAINDIVWTDNGNQYFFYAGLVSNFYGSIYGQWAGAVDKYVAYRFSPDGTNLHYAWIRCDVDSIGTQLTVKDFAYEATPNIPIVAGSLTGIAPAPNAAIGIFEFDSKVYIHAKDGNITDAIVRLWNAKGQVVYTGALASALHVIHGHSWAKGMYLVEVNRAGQTYQKKILLR